MEKWEDTKGYLSGIFEECGVDEWNCCVVCRNMKR